MKRVLVVLLIVIVCGAAALLWLGRLYLTDWARLRLARELTRATGAVSTIDALTVSLFPPDVSITALAIGTTPALARIDAIEARVAPLPSLKEGRLVVSIRVDAPAFDLSHLPKSDTPAAEPPRTPAAGLRVPPLHLSDIEMTHLGLQFRLGKDTARLTVEQLTGHLESGLLRHGFTAGLDVRAAELWRKGYTARLDEIQADGGFDSGGAYVSSAHVTSERLTAAVNATLAAHQPAVEVTFDPGILGVLVDELSLLSGQAHLTGTLGGDLRDPTNEGQLTIEHGAIAQHVLGDLSTHVTHHRAHLGFDAIHLSGAKGQVSGTVDMVVAKEVPIHGELSWKGIDLERMLAIIGPSIPLEDQFTATTSVQGALDPLDLTIEAHGSVQAARAGPAEDAASFALTGRVHPHDLDAQLELEQPQQNTVQTHVLVTGDRFGGSIRLTAADLRPLNGLLPRPVPALALTGRAEGSAEFSGTTEHPAVSGTLALREATIAGTPVTRLTSDFAIAAQTLRTKATALETAGGQLALDGIVALDREQANDWHLALHDLDTDLALNAVRGLTEVQAPLNGGTLNGTFACRGPWARTQLQATLSAKGPRLGTEPLDHVNVDASTTLPRWNGTLLVARNATETVQVTGNGDGLAHLDVRFETTPLVLTTVRATGRRRIMGTVTAHGHVVGAPLRLGGDLEVTADNVGLGRHRLRPMSLRADGDAGTWRLRGSAFDDSVTLAGTVRSAAGLPYTTTVTWHDTELAPVITADDSLHVTTSGSLNLTGSLLAPATPSGSVRVDQFLLRRDPGQVEAAEPMRVDFDRGRFSIGSLALAAHGSRLSLRGQGTLTGDLDLDVQGDGDLVLLELIGEPLHAARGAYSVSAHVGHRQSSGWELRGHATIRDAVLDLGLPVAFTDTNGSFSLVGGSVHVDQLSGRAGGGEFSADGTLDLNRGPALSWSVREVSLTLPEWLEERVSGKGQVQGSWKVMTVSGDIEVLNALYDRRIELGALLPWFKEQVAPAPQIGPPRREVRLDLHIHAPDGLFVDNNFAKAEMRCDLRISGRAQQPALGGLIEVLDGEVTFRNRVFTLTGGSVEFRDPERINPILNLSAESQISTAESEYTVSVAISGTADNPRVQFTADDPTLTQNDVLSLVTFGQTTTQSTRDSGNTVGMGDVLGLVPSEYTGDVQGRVRSLFGVDRLEVDPAYVRDTGAIEPRVTIGKDLTDRLRAVASSSISAEARHSMQLEYRLTRRISVLGLWESRTQSQAGAFGGDIKFRYEFRTLPFSLWSPASSAPGDAP